MAGRPKSTPPSQSQTPSFRLPWMAPTVTAAVPTRRDSRGPSAATSAPPQKERQPKQPTAELPEPVSAATRGQRQPSWLPRAEEAPPLSPPQEYAPNRSAEPRKTEKDAIGDTMDVSPAIDATPAKIGATAPTTEPIQPEIDQDSTVEFRVPMAAEELIPLKQVAPAPPLPVLPADENHNASDTAKEVIKEVPGEDTKPPGTVTAAASAVLPLAEPLQSVEQPMSPLPNADHSVTPQPSLTQQSKSIKANLNGTHHHRQLGHEQAKFQKEIRDGVNELIRKLGGTPAHGGAAMQVITLAGENKGAWMQIHPDGATSDGGTTVSLRRPIQTIGGGKSVDGTKETAEPAAAPTTAVINCNVQSINNSLVMYSSCSEGDAGVHLKLVSKSGAKSQQEIHGGVDHPSSVAPIRSAPAATRDGKQKVDH